MWQDFDILYSKYLLGDGLFELYKSSILHNNFATWHVKSLILRISELH